VRKGYDIDEEDDPIQNHDVLGEEQDHETLEEKKENV
jgi:hypothetical protein